MPNTTTVRARGALAQAIDTSTTCQEVMGSIELATQVFHLDHLKRISVMLPEIWVLFGSKGY